MQLQRKKIGFYRLFYTQWFNDCQKAIKKVSEAVAHNENMKSEECYSVLYGYFVDRMRARYIPSDHRHVSKNIHIFGLLKRIITAFVFRIFNKIPFLDKKYTQEFIANKLNSNNIETLIKTVKRG